MNASAHPQNFIYASHIMPLAQNDLASAKIQAALRGQQRRKRFHRIKQAAKTIQNTPLVKKAKDTVKYYKRVKERTAYQEYFASHTLDNHFDEWTGAELEGWDGLQLLRGFRRVLKQAFQQHNGVKIHLSALLEFRNHLTEETHTRWITTPIK